MSTIDAHPHAKTAASRERSEAWLRALMAESPLSTQIFSPDGRTIQVNRAWEKLWGATIDLVADYNILQDPQLEERGIASYIRRGFSGEALAIPAVWYDPDETLPDRSTRPDSRRWVRAFIHPIRNHAGEVTEVVLIHEDITDQKLAEEALRQSEERLRLALAAGRMGVWEWDLRTNSIWWSDNLETIHGLPRGAFDGTMDGFASLLHPDDRAGMYAAVQEAIERRADYDKEFRIVWPDGSVHWMAGKGQVFANDSGVPVRMMGVGMDVTARREAELERDRLLEALSESEETFRGIVAQSIAGVAEIDLEARFIFANPRYCDIVGRPIDELLKLSMQDISHPEDLPENLRLLDRMLMDGTPYVVEKRYIRPDGSHVWVNNSVSALRDRDGNLKAIVAVCVDVTDRRQAEEALRRADRRKTEFLATLAHELRNPLAPIVNGLKLLELAESSPATRREARGVMNRQVQQLVRLVDDLLDISRITRNRLELRKERVHLTSVLDSAVETARPLIESFGHELAVDLPQEPVLLNADLTRLAQVVSNLLTNAAKYTNRGGRIILKATSSAGEVVLSVKDNGIGVAAEHLPQLFEMFSQVTSALERSEGGLGIGLALVRGLVEMHGGSVEARSDGLGRGSEFIVRLPVMTEQPAASRPSKSHTPTAAPGDVAGCRVLVVDDNVDSALTLSALLKRYGHQTQIAHDGTAALDKAGDFLPEVVLLDIGMPRMNGYEVARRIREQPWGGDMTLVAVTGWGQDEDKRQAELAGFDHHLTKPLDFAALREIFNGERC
ncbi:MAG TPA: PAS domain S-box protein [Lacipirellula sp.]